MYLFNAPSSDWGDPKGANNRDLSYLPLICYVRAARHPNYCITSMASLQMFFENRVNMPFLQPSRRTSPICGNHFCQPTMNQSGPILERAGALVGVNMASPILGFRPQRTSKNLIDTIVAATQAANRDQR